MTGRRPRSSTAGRTGTLVDARRTSAGASVLADACGGGAEQPARASGTPSSLARPSVATALKQELHANRFEKWVLDHVLHDLCTTASHAAPRALRSAPTRCRSTSAASFVVVDHRNADEARLARTLSGGETFLASLALALALAEQVASRLGRRRPPRVAVPRRGLRHARRRHARRGRRRPSRTWGRGAAWSAWSATCPSWPSGCRSASRSAGGLRSSTVERVDQ